VGRLSGRPGDMADTSPAFLALAAEISAPGDPGDDRFDFPGDLDAAIDEYSMTVRSMPQNVVEEFFADPDLRQYHDHKYDAAEGLTDALKDLTEIARSFKTTFRPRKDGV